MRIDDSILKEGAKIIWANAGPIHDQEYWEQIWEFETRPERVEKIGEWWPITAARKIFALIEDGV